MSVQVVEGFCGIRAGDLREHDGAAGVGVDEVAQVVDFVVDDCPEVFFGVVLWRFVLVFIRSCCLNVKVCSIPWRLRRGGVFGAAYWLCGS